MPSKDRAVSVFDYTDYRLFLQDLYRERKSGNRDFTHRFISEQVGFKSSGFLTQIFQGKSNISPESAKRLASFFGLNEKEQEYFLLTVSFNQAKTPREKQALFERIIAFGKGRVAQVDAAQYEFYDKWYYTVVREILAYVRIDDSYESQVQAAKLIVPPIRPLQVKHSIQLLERLGLVHKSEDGSYQRTDRVISSGYETQSVAVTRFADQALELAHRALMEMPRPQRSISSVTLSLSESGYREVEEKIKVLRRELLEVARRDNDADRVYHVGIQVFPFTHSLSDGGEG